MMVESSELKPEICVRTPFNPVPRSVLYRTREDYLYNSQERHKAVGKLFTVVNTGPSLLDVMEIVFDELEGKASPESIREADRQYQLRLAVSTLGAKSINEEHLRNVFFYQDHADKIIAEGIPRDLNGDPITAQFHFGITDRQARATALKFGIQDGRTRSLSEVAGMLGVDEKTAGEEVIATIRKFRHTRLEYTDLSTP